MALVNILSRKMIKPSAPTPDELRSYRISYTDEMAPAMMGPTILYYSCNPDQTITKFQEALQTSLAQTLCKFYPLAGRYIKERYTVDCSDQGAEYVEAKVGCTLLELTGPGMQPEKLSDLLPCPLHATEGINDPMLSIQVNKFQCGGVAIAVCISHRIADVSTAGTFITAWANASLGKESKQVVPNFNSSLYFPGRNIPKLELGNPETTGNTHDTKIITERFVFDPIAISRIRAQLIPSSNGSPEPTKVQLVSGFILRALLDIDQAKFEQTRSCLITQTVNFRNKTRPPFPEHSCGNLCVFARAHCSGDEIKLLGLHGCIHLLNKAARKTIADCEKILDSEEDADMIIVKPFDEVTQMLSNYGDQLNALLINSWCRVPFYEADFGWEKPVWVSIGSLPVKNSVLRMDTKEGDGIEAWVSLEEKDMECFQNDESMKTLMT